MPWYITVLEDLEDSKLCLVKVPQLLYGHGTLPVRKSHFWPIGTRVWVAKPDSNIHLEISNPLARLQTCPSILKSLIFQRKPPDTPPNITECLKILSIILSAFLLQFLNYSSCHFPFLIPHIRQPSNSRILFCCCSSYHSKWKDISLMSWTIG